TLESVPLCSLSAGSLFGELDIDRHCCSAIVTRQAEFVRISQRHFVSLYNKHADHLQSFIVVMQDMLSEEQAVPSHLVAGRAQPDGGIIHPHLNGDVNGINAGGLSYAPEYQEVYIKDCLNMLFYKRSNIVNKGEETQWEE
ncbi:hypothetical protein ANCDUO_16833, partial [Ancylostoma duodenale]